MSPGGQSNLLLIRRLLHPSKPDFDSIWGRFFAQVLPKLWTIQKLLSDVGLLIAGKIEEALNTGGTGYVVKANAGSQLLDAIDVMRSGGQFVGTACRVMLVPPVEQAVKQP
jgi:hypothetical protein